LAIRGEVRGNDVVIEFEDSGCGIRADDLERVFQPFWSRRADGVQ